MTKNDCSLIIALKDRGFIMADKKKMNAATRRVKSGKKIQPKKTQHRTGFWKRVWNIICWPFRKLAKICRAIWKWICGLNLIGLLNATLLIAIIVLFTMLILDFTKCGKRSVVIMAPGAEQTIPTLPMKNKTANKSVNVVPVKKYEIESAKRQVAQQKKHFSGDLIIDSRGAGKLLQNQSQVDGNVYVQNMTKYTLPCDVVINGNLFLRDIGLLQFCGEFTVTGNIYVSPRSTFGPIPKTARIGGYVVL